MWKIRFFRLASLRHLVAELRAERERGDRLEIAQRRQALKLNELATDIERLSDRLCAAQGRAAGGLGGRPRRAPGQQHELRLEDIPPGDKKALREYFRTHPPAKTDDTEH